MIRQTQAAAESWALNCCPSPDFSAKPSCSPFAEPAKVGDGSCGYTMGDISTIQNGRCVALAVYHTSVTPRNIGKEIMMLVESDPTYE